MDTVTELNQLADSIGQPDQGKLLQADYTRKTQELAAKAKQLEAREQRLNTNFLTNIDTLRSEAATVVTDDDAYTPDGIAKISRRSAAELRLRELEPVIREQQRVELETKVLQEREYAIEQFAKKNADYTDLVPDIIKAIESNPDLNAVSAYYVVKAEQAKREAEELRKQVKTQNIGRRQDALAIGGGTTTSVKAPPRGKMDAVETYRHFASQKK